MSDFSHLDEQGQPNMVNVSEKKTTKRMAKARSKILLPENIIRLFENGDLKTAKGSVIQTAIIAGIMAAKNTGNLIPLCHPIGLDNCNITIVMNEKNEMVIECTTQIEAKTGVEMEALVGASVAALTVYDMCKALSHDIIISETCLIQKIGGKNDYKRS